MDTEGFFSNFFIRKPIINMVTILLVIINVTIPIYPVSIVKAN